MNDGIRQIFEKTPKPPCSGQTMDFEKQELLKKELEKLRNEHSELDRKIKRMTHEPPLNHIAIQGLKKQKLVLKDRIEKVRSKLLPDIIA